MSRALLFKKRYHSMNGKISITAGLLNIYFFIILQLSTAFEPTIHFYTAVSRQR
jgi:hypothetical protein